MVSFKFDVAVLCCLIFWIVWCGCRPVFQPWTGAEFVLLGNNLLGGTGAEEWDEKRIAKGFKLGSCMAFNETRSRSF